MPATNHDQQFFIGEAATYLGVSRDTLRRWEEKNILVPQRLPANDYRVYTKQQLDEMLPK